MMNAYEINLALRGLQALEVEMCNDWKKAQKVNPYGARATSFADTLKEIRKLHDKLDSMRRSTGQS